MIRYGARPRRDQLFESTNSGCADGRSSETRIEGLRPRASDHDAEYEGESHLSTVSPRSRARSTHASRAGAGSASRQMGRSPQTYLGCRCGFPIFDLLAHQCRNIRISTPRADCQLVTALCATARAELHTSRSHGRRRSGLDPHVLELAERLLFAKVDSCSWAPQDFRQAKRLLAYSAVPHVSQKCDEVAAQEEGFVPVDQPDPCPQCSQGNRPAHSSVTGAAVGWRGLPRVPQ